MNASEVNLVAVVTHRVMARRNHDARVGVEFSDSKGEDRCGHRSGQENGPHLGAGHDLCGIAGKRVGVGSGIVANHHNRHVTAEA